MPLPRAPVTQRLYLLFTPGLCRTDPWRTLEAALAGGVDLVQWRVKSEDPAGLRRAQALCAAAGVPLIVNDDVELALTLDLAGAHVGQEDMPAVEARARLGQRWLGVSTHDLAQIRAAEAAGADYLGFGPCFPTSTKGYAQGQTSEARRQAFAQCTKPVFAIGGIHADNLALLSREGCRRIAVSSCVLTAQDPKAAAAQLRAALDRSIP